MAVLACAMVSVGWRAEALAIGAALALAAGATIRQVRTALAEMDASSQSVRRAAEAAERHYVGVLRKVVQFVESRDPYLTGHSDNVGRLTRQVAAEMGLPAGLCEQLGLAGELHDIGLLAVPEHVLEHVRFGVEHFRSVQRHSEVSFRLLEPLEMLAEVLPAIRHHHERFNGTGYPAGLAGEDIPLGARILAVADAYDAMTHDRPHRPALTPLEAVEELRRCTPAGYDPQCVAALGEVLHAPALREALVTADG